MGAAALLPVASERLLLLPPALSSGRSSPLRPYEGAWQGFLLRVARGKRSAILLDITAYGQWLHPARFRALCKAVWRSLTML